MQLQYPEQPRALKCERARAERRKLLDQDHIRPLTDYVERLRLMELGSVPDFDPLDGGVNAEILFLMEKPGRMADGSGFISRDNNDETAAAVFYGMNKTGICRSRAVLWNFIPWWNGTRKINAAERLKGLEATAELMKNLPKLKSVVLVGKKAERAEDFFETTELAIFKSAHPSPIVRARYRDRWDRIPEQWAEAARSAGI